MVFATTPQILRPSFLTPDFTDKLLGHEKLSTSCDRVFYLQPKSALRKARKEGGSDANKPKALRENVGNYGSSSVASSACSAPSTPKAVKENVTAFRANSVAPSFPSLQPDFVILGKDPPSTLSMQAWSDIEELLTELKRSLLETQWTLAAVNPVEPDLSPSVSSSQTEEICNIVRSPRQSARQRRIQSKKQNAQCSDENLNSAAPPTSQARKGKQLTMHQPLDSISTKGFTKDKIKRELLTPEEEVILAKKMKVGQNLKAAREKLKKILGCEPPDEMWAMSVKLPFRELQSKLREADRARDHMFMSNLKLVVSVAKKYNNCGVSMADLIQEGARGLLRGLEKFDHKKGFKLSTYVHWWIRQRIARAISEHSRTVRLPAHMHERLGIISRITATLRAEGVAVSVKSISKASNMSNAMVSSALRARKRMISLDKAKRWGNFDHEDDTLHNYVADPHIENNPWAVITKSLMREDIDTLLTTTLCKRERDIVRLHYGLDHADGRRVSLETISHRIGISRERTRQVAKCALRKLAVTSRFMDLDIPHDN